MQNNTSGLSDLSRQVKEQQDQQQQQRIIEQQAKFEQMFQAEFLNKQK